MDGRQVNLKWLWTLSIVLTGTCVHTHCMRVQQDYKYTDLMEVSSGLEFKKEYKTFERQNTSNNVFLSSNS